MIKMEDDLKDFLAFMAGVYHMTPQEVMKESTEDLKDWFMLYYTAINPTLDKRSRDAVPRICAFYVDKLKERGIMWAKKQGMVK